MSPCLTACPMPRLKLFGIAEHRLAAGRWRLGCRRRDGFRPQPAAIATLIFLLVGRLAVLNLKATRMKFDAGADMAGINRDRSAGSGG